MCVTCALPALPVPCRAVWERLEQAEALAAEAAALWRASCRPPGPCADGARRCRTGDQARATCAWCSRSPARLARPRPGSRLRHWPSAWPLEAMVAGAGAGGHCCSTPRSIRTRCPTADANFGGTRATTQRHPLHPAATSARQGGMPWDRGAAVPAAQPASRSASVSASKPAAPAPQPAPTPTPQPVAAPAPATAPAPKPQSNNAAQVAAAGTAETPALRMPESCSANGPGCRARVKARRTPTRGFCSMPAPRRATAPGWSRSPRTNFAIKMLGCLACAVGGPADSQCGLGRHRRLCPGWGGTRLLNMRSILHLHGLRYLRTTTRVLGGFILERQRDAAKKQHRWRRRPRRRLNPIMAKPAAPTPAPKPASPAPKSS